MPTTLKTKPGENRSLAKYNKIKDFVKYYRLKKRLLPSQYTEGDESRAKKFQKMYLRLRKQVASLLLQNLRKKRAARGRGKKRGSDLANINSR